MSDQFDSPASASAGVKWNELSGRLLLIKPLSFEAGVQTSFGESDAVKADVIELDGPDAGTEHTEALVFPKILVSQLKPKVGKQVLGRLGKGQAKPGQSAPHVLGEATDQDKDVARKYLAQSQAAPF